MNRDPRLPAADLPRARITLGGLREAAPLFAYVLPYRRKLAAALACLVLSSLTGLAYPYFTGRLIDSAQRGLGEAAAGPLLPVAGLGVNAVALLLLAAMALGAAASFGQNYWLTDAGERSLAALRQDTYARLLGLPMAFFAQRRVGELASRITADLAQIQHGLTGSIPQVLGQVVVLAGGLPLMALTSGRLTLVLLLTLPVVLALTTAFGRLIRRFARETQDRLADTNVVVEETLQGIAVVKAFANEGHETARYGAGMAALIDTALRAALYGGAFMAFSSFTMFGSMVLTMWYGARLVEARVLTFGQLTQFLLYSMYVGGAFGRFAFLHTQLQQTLGATQRVRELLQETPEDVGDGRCEAGGRPPRIAGDVAFEGVSFSYPARPDVTVLRNLALTAEAGQRIALVGPSGAGKSTIVSLLLRFYAPDAGRVLIDGRDARDYPLRGLRAQMAIVPQDVLLFGGTIADNIAYGRPGAGQVEIEAAARQANAHDFIAAFPEGYRTVVGERGVKLSGGQRQRVAIARAILRDPAILILDEATSSLDSESERLVQQALEVLMRGRTSVIIAHRLSTVRRAVRIYVIKEGEVVEAGTHAELLVRPDGVYRTLSELQFDLGGREGREATPVDAGG
jgi:ATP-binding cassette subfamily B protein